MCSPCPALKHSDPEDARRRHTQLLPPAPISATSFSFPGLPRRTGAAGSTYRAVHRTPPVWSPPPPLRAGHRGCRPAALPGPGTPSPPPTHPPTPPRAAAPAPPSASRSRLSPPRPAGRAGWARGGSLTFSTFSTVKSRPCGGGGGGDASALRSMAAAALRRRRRAGGSGGARAAASRRDPPPRPDEGGGSRAARIGADRRGREAPEGRPERSRRAPLRCGTAWPRRRGRATRGTCRRAAPHHGSGSPDPRASPAGQRAPAPLPAHG